MSEEHAYLARGVVRALPRARRRSHSGRGCVRSQGLDSIRSPLVGRYRPEREHGYHRVELRVSRDQPLPGRSHPDVADAGAHPPGHHAREQAASSQAFNAHAAHIHSVGTTPETIADGASASTAPPQQQQDRTHADDSDEAEHTALSHSPSSRTARVSSRRCAYSPR